MSTEQTESNLERPEVLIGREERPLNRTPADQADETEAGRRTHEQLPPDAEIDDNYVVSVPQGLVFRRRRPTQS